MALLGLRVEGPQVSDPIAYCPACKGGVADPLLEYVEHCYNHRPDADGSADALVSLSWNEGHSVETAEETRAACRFIHGDACDV